MLPDPPNHILPDNRQEFPLDSPEPPSRGRVLALTAAFVGFSVAGLLLGRLTAPEPREEPALSAVDQIVALQREATARNCVLFTAVQGSSDARAAQATVRMLSAYAEGKGVSDHAEAIVGRVTLPDGRRVIVVTGASEMCFTEPSVPVGGP